MELQGKIQETFEHFTPASSPEEIDKIVEGIIARRYKAAYSADTLRFLFSTIDLTTLAGADTKESVKKLVELVNHTASHPEEGLPNVAAVCVYPLQVPVVKGFMKADGVRIAAVSGGFPASQTFLEIKLAETALTVAAGANEIDIVLNLNHFLPGNYSAVVEEIEEQKAACRSAHLKVILETGLLKDPELVRKASILSTPVPISSRLQPAKSIPVPIFVLPIRCVVPFVTTAKRPVSCEGLSSPEGSVRPKMRSNITAL